MTDKPVVLTASMASNLLRLLDADADLYGAQALRDLAAGRTLCVVNEPVAVVKNCHLGKIDWLDAALNEHGELKLKDDELLYRAQEK